MRVTPGLPLKTKSPRVCNICAGICFVLVIVGILCATVIHSVVYQALENGLNQKFVLSGPEAGDFQAWSQPTAPGSPVIFTDFYIHHVLNPNEVALNGARPNLTEIGPIRYNFFRERLNVTFDASLQNDQLTFIPYNYYVALPDEETYQATVLCEDDRTRTCTVTTSTSKIAAMVFTTVNIPLTGVLHSAAASLPGLLYDVIQQVNMSAPTALFTQKTAEQIIFGWEDPLLKALSGIAGNPTYYPGMQQNMTSADHARAVHSPTTMWTGALTKHLARNYARWDGMEQLECCSYGVCGDAGSHGLSQPVQPWMTTDAETIRGAFGEQTHTFVDPTETLYVSTHDFGILRWWPMQNAGSGPSGSGTDIAGTGANGGSAGDTEEVKGITLLKFTFAPGTLGNSSVSPDEAFAYNNYGPSGVLNQTQCFWGAQVFVSQPRFYGGSNSLREGVLGLGPATEEEHGTYLGVEPFTGSTMDFHWRVGINILVEPTPLKGAPVPLFFPNAPTVYLPIAWADRYGQISDDEATQFKSQVYVARDVLVSSRWGGTGLACVALISGIVFLLLASRRRQDQQHARELSAAAFYASNAGLGGDSVYTPFLPPPGYVAGDDGLSPLSDAMIVQGPGGTTTQLGVAGGLNAGVGLGRSINAAPTPKQQGAGAFAGGGFFSPTTAAANGPGGILANAQVWEEEVTGGNSGYNYATATYEEGASTAPSSFGAPDVSPFPVVRQLPRNAADMMPPESPVLPQGGGGGKARGQQQQVGRASFDVDNANGSGSGSGSKQQREQAAAARTWSATAGHY